MLLECKSHGKSRNKVLLTLGVCGQPRVTHTNSSLTLNANTTITVKIIILEGIMVRFLPRNIAGVHGGGGRGGCYFRGLHTFPPYCVHPLAPSMVGE